MSKFKMAVAGAVAGVVNPATMRTPYVTAREAQEALKLVATWIGQNTDIRIVWHDGNSVYANVDQKTLHIPRFGHLDPETLMKLRLFVYHEAGHIAKTHLPKHLRPKKPALFEILNSLEDRRMESELSAEHAGCRKVFEWGNRYYNRKVGGQIQSGEVSAPLWEACCAMGFRVNGLTLAWTPTEQAQLYIDAAYDEFRKVVRAKSTEDCLEIAKRIYALLKEVKRNQKQQPQQQSQPQDGESGESDQQGEGQEGEPQQGSSSHAAPQRPSDIDDDEDETDGSEGRQAEAGDDEDEDSDDQQSGGSAGDSDDSENDSDDQQADGSSASDSDDSDADDEASEDDSDAGSEGDSETSDGEDSEDAEDSESGSGTDEAGEDDDESESGPSGASDIDDEDDSDSDASEDSDSGSEGESDDADEGESDDSESGSEDSDSDSDGADFDSDSESGAEDSDGANDTDDADGSESDDADASDSDSSDSDTDSSSDSDDADAGADDGETDSSEDDALDKEAGEPDNLDAEPSTDGNDEPEEPSSNEMTDEEIERAIAELEAEFEAELEAEVEDGTRIEDMMAEEIAKALGEMDPLDREYTALKDNDVHVIPDVTPEQRRLLVALRRTVASAVAGMSRHLEQALLALARCRKQPYMEYGKIDKRRYVHIAKSLSKQVFHKTRKGQKLNAAVVMVIDESGSMSSSYKEVQKLAFIMGEVLDKLGVPFEIVGTTTSNGHYDTDGFTRSRPIVYRHYKSFGERWVQVAARVTTTSYHNNNIDGEAVEYAAGRLATRREDRRVVFSLSDGEPCGGQGYDRDLLLGRNLTRVCERVRAAGIEVYGFGVQTTEPLKYYGAEWFIYLDSVATMGVKFFQSFAAILTKGRVRVGRGNA